MEEIKSMIHEKDIPMHLWEKEMKATMYMHNKSPHKVLEKKTPEEMFSGEKP
jgi:hypothetical protein